jgi:hypothetical protein
MQEVVVGLQLLVDFHLEDQVVAEMVQQLVEFQVQLILVVEVAVVDFIK